MSTKIQFKKLVWKIHKEDGCIVSSALLFDFIIRSDDNGGFVLKIYSGAVIDKRLPVKSADKAKQIAQKWFEKKLTKFIETSETLAQ